MSYWASIDDKNVHCVDPTISNIAAKRQLYLRVIEYLIPGTLVWSQQCDGLVKDFINTNTYHHEKPSGFPQFKMPIRLLQILFDHRQLIAILLHFLWKVCSICKKVRLSWKVFGLRRGTYKDYFQTGLEVNRWRLFRAFAYMRTLLNENNVPTGFMMLCWTVGPPGDTEGSTEVWESLQYAWSGEGDGATSRAGLHETGTAVRPRLAGDAQPCYNEGDHNEISSYTRWMTLFVNDQTVGTLAIVNFYSFCIFSKTLHQCSKLWCL